MKQIIDTFADKQVSNGNGCRGSLIKLRTGLAAAGRTAKHHIVMTQENKRPFAMNHISVDCVVLGFDGERLNVLLTRRNDIKLHDMKLPGSLIYADEDLDEAAARIVKEHTGMKGNDMVQFQAFGSLDRTSKPEDVQWLERSQHEKVERIVTVAYFSIQRIRKIATVKDTDSSLIWVPVDNLPPLAFDHNKIVAAAVDYFARMAYFNNEYFFQLLPKKFTILQFRKLYELVYRTKTDPGNFHKKVCQMPHVVPLDEMETGKRHRAARFYRYDKKTFKKNKI